MKWNGQIDQDQTRSCLSDLPNPNKSTSFLFPVVYGTVMSGSFVPPLSCLIVLARLGSPKRDEADSREAGLALDIVLAFFLGGGKMSRRPLLPPADDVRCGWILLLDKAASAGIISSSGAEGGFEAFPNSGCDGPILRGRLPRSRNGMDAWASPGPFF